MSGNSAIQISGATLEVGGTVTFNNIPLTIVTVSGDTAILTGMFNPAPVANVDTVTVAGAAPVGPTVVEKKFVQQNDGALGGSLTDLRATSIEVAAGGNIDMGGNQIHNVAEGTAQSDVVVVSQLETYVSAQISAADSVNDAEVSAIESRLTVAENELDAEASIRAAADVSLASDRKTIHFKDSFHQVYRDKLNLNTRSLEEVLNDDIWSVLFDSFDDSTRAWVECEQKCSCGLVDQEYAVGWLTN